MSQRESIEKSKGHLGFLGIFEYFQTEDGTLYRAYARNWNDQNGYKVGARFEATPTTARAVWQHANTLDWTEA
jgi:hypothetical protein